MLSRYLCAITLLGLVLAPSAARPADEKVTPPTVQVRLNSLDRLLDDFKYFLSLTGQKEAIDQFEGMKGALLPLGFDGIDAKKPWALYGALDAGNVQDSAAVLLVPVTNEKAFLGLLDKALHLKPTKDGDYYMVQPDNVPVPIYFRFTEGYACAAGISKAALEKGKLIPPSVMFAKPQASSAEVHFRIDQIPNEYKQLALGQVEVQLANAKEQKIAGENEAQRQGRLQGIESVGQMFSALVKDGTDISFDVDISRAKGKFGVGLGVGAKSGSDLAKKFGTMGAGNSLFAGWINPSSPANLVVHAALGETVQKMLEEIVNHGLAGLAKDGEPQRIFVDKLKKVLAPTIQAKSVDLGFDWRGPSPAGHYTLAAGLKVVDGDKIEGLAKELIAQIPEKDRTMIKLDASSVGEFKVHRLDVAGMFDADARRIFGDNPIYFAFRKDALLVSAGENGLPALSEALQAGPAAAPMARGNVNLKGLVPLMKNDPGAEGQSKKSFVHEGDDAVTLSVNGGEALQIRVEFTGAVFQFAAALGNKKK
jgi:hypothetical protein